MRIVQVGNFHENSVGEPEIAKSLEELGHTVFRVDERFATIEGVERKLNEVNPDFLLVNKFRLETYLDRERFLKRTKVPVVAWLFDLYFGM